MEKEQLWNLSIKDKITESHKIIEQAFEKYNRIARELSKLPSLSIKKISVKDKKMTIYTPKAESTIKHLLKIAKKTNESILSLNVQRPSLEEIFEEISKSKQSEVILEGD